MAVVLGTSGGFVTSAPVDDPVGTGVTFDTYGAVTKDTVPATAAKITEVGFYISNATEEAAIRVALYDDNGAVVPGEAGTRLFLSSDGAKGTTEGWKRITVDWDISAYQGTALWIGAGLDNTATATLLDSAVSGGSGFDYRPSQSAMPTPFGGGSLVDADGVLAIYALWEAAAGGSNTPSNTISQTPSNTVSATPSNTISQTPSNTVSQTPSNTISQTPSNTVSQTPSNTVSQTPSNTVSETPSNTISQTVSETPSNTISQTPAAPDDVVPPTPVLSIEK